MNRKFLVLGMVVAFVLGICALAFEPHPQIRAAQTALDNAMNHLQRADTDFGGHRLKAMDHIRAAQVELKEALRFDR